MKTFTLDSICPKCGCDEASCNWRKKVTKDDLKNGGGFMAGWIRATGPEIIQRTCSRCGYSWDEEPLDVIKGHKKSQVKGCEYCYDKNPLWDYTPNEGIAPRIVNFCPFCGIKRSWEEV